MTVKSTRLNGSSFQILTRDGSISSVNEYANSKHTHRRILNTQFPPDTRRVVKYLTVSKRIQLVSKHPRQEELRVAN